MIFIASLFVVSEALDATGVTAWAGQQLIDRSGASRTRLLVLMMLLVAALDGADQPNGVGRRAAARHRRDGRAPPAHALAAPAAARVRRARGLAARRSPASPVNVIVSETADDAGVGRFGFFEFALVGLPLLAVSIAFVVLFGERLLPASQAPLDHAPTSARTRARSSSSTPSTTSDGLLTRRGGVAEVLDPAPLGADRRRGLPGDGHGRRRPSSCSRCSAGRRTLAGETVLAAGDTLLLQGAWGALEERLDAPDLLVVDEPERGPPAGGAARPGREDDARRPRRRWSSCSRTGAVPPAVAGLLAAGAIVLSACSRSSRPTAAIQWTTVILVAGMIPLSTAMTSSGAAETLADGLVDLVGEAGPRFLLLGIVVLVLVLGQLIATWRPR